MCTHHIMDSALLRLNPLRCSTRLHACLRFRNFVSPARRLDFQGPRHGRRKVSSWTSKTKESKSARASACPCERVQRSEEREADARAREMKMWSRLQTRMHYNGTGSGSRSPVPFLQQLFCMNLCALKKGLQKMPKRCPGAPNRRPVEDKMAPKSKNTNH